MNAHIISRSLLCGIRDCSARILFRRASSAARIDPQSLHSGSPRSMCIPGHGLTRGRFPTPTSSTYSSWPAAPMRAAGAYPARRSGRQQPWVCPCAAPCGTGPSHLPVFCRRSTNRAGHRSACPTRRESLRRCVWCCVHRCVCCVWWWDTISGTLGHRALQPLVWPRTSTSITQKRGGSP
jgi:hypothetical protein